MMPVRDRNQIQREAPPEIYLDFDDVIAETIISLAQFAESDFGKPHREPEELKEFDLHISLGLSPSEYDRFMERFHANLLPSIPEMPGAGEVLRAWQSEDIATPVVVTGRPPWSEPGSRQWLKDRQLENLELLHVDKYGRAGNAPGWTDFETLKTRRFALAVDDAPGALDALSRSRLCPFVVFKRPWNERWESPSGGAAPVGRVATWHELDELARRLLSTEGQMRS